MPSGPKTSIVTMATSAAPTDHLCLVGVSSGCFLGPFLMFGWFTNLNLDILVASVLPLTSSLSCDS